MRFDLRDIPTSIVSYRSPDKKTRARRESIFNILEGSKFKDYTMVDGLYSPGNPIYGCSVSHAMTIENVLRGNVPALILEDDVGFYSRDFMLDIPDDADAVYLGLSTAGLSWNDTKMTHAWKNIFHTPEGKYSRIYNMLSTHAVLIVNENFGRHYQLCALESAIRNIPIDCILARCQQHFNVYAKNRPIFYQQKHLGGQQKFTKINSIKGIKIAGSYYLPEHKLNVSCFSEDLCSMDTQ